MGNDSVRRSGRALDDGPAFGSSHWCGRFTAVQWRCARTHQLCRRSRISQQPQQRTSWRCSTCPLFLIRPPPPRPPAPRGRLRGVCGGGAAHDAGERGAGRRCRAALGSTRLRTRSTPKRSRRLRPSTRGGRPRCGRWASRAILLRGTVPFMGGAKGVGGVGTAAAGDDGSADGKHSTLNDGPGVGGTPAVSRLRARRGVASESSAIDAAKASARRLVYVGWGVRRCTGLCGTAGRTTRRRRRSHCRQ